MSWLRALRRLSAAALQVRNWNTRGVAAATLVLSLALSPLIWVAVYIGDFHRLLTDLPDGIGYEAYFDKLNWWPFPLFLIALWSLVKRSWEGFNIAWINSAKVIRRLNGRASSENDRQAIVAYMNTWRKYLLVAACISSVLYISIEVRPLWTIYTTPSAATQIFVAVKNEPDWFAKFVFLEDARMGYERTLRAQFVDSPEDLYDLGGSASYAASGAQYAVTLLSYAQLTTLVMMAFLVLYQILTQMAFFAYFDRLPASRRLGITLWLKHDDEFNEFGLYEFNRALNSLYWIISLCLVMPLLSKLEQAELSTLHFVGNLLVSGIPLAPLFLTVIARQYWTGPCKERASKDQPKGPSRFNEQRVLPLTANNLHAAGILVAIALTSALIGVDLVDYAKVLIP